MFDPDARMFNRFGDPRGMGGFRAGRGMVEPAILRVLDKKPMHGYEIISTLEEETHGMWRPSAGSIYPTLQLLEEKGLIVSKEVDGKKVFSLTDEGRTEVKSDPRTKAWENRATNLHYFREVQDDMAHVIHLMRQIGRKGTEEQKQAFTKAIKGFRSTLEHVMEGKA